MSKAPSRLLVCALVLMAPALLRSEPAVIGLARAYLGPESTLEGLKSIHFVGTLDRTGAAPGVAATHTDLDMVFEKPLRQHTVMRAEKATMTTVLDGYNGWDWLQDNSNAAKHRLIWLQLPDLRTLRANTWENLYYYKTPEGGSVEDKGPVAVDGIDCERVDFDHGSGVVYQRFFDRDTGRLVLTVLGAESFKESGEIRVEGIRFPRTIISTVKTPKGVITETATFTKVALDEPVAESLFTLPSAVPAK
ncbi:MAG TPA: hypothetical protein VFE25_07860 [Opitutaceae bacterium]|jgi:hypothetical protein|nr:hypothetical protein [Opitutaceae bacterium]